MRRIVISVCLFACVASAQSHPPDEKALDRVEPRQVEYEIRVNNLHSDVVVKPGCRVDVIVVVQRKNAKTESKFILRNARVSAVTPSIVTLLGDKQGEIALKAALRTGELVFTAPNPNRIPGTDE